MIRLRTSLPPPPPPPLNRPHLSHARNRLGHEQDVWPQGQYLGHQDVGVALLLLQQHVQGQQAARTAALKRDGVIDEQHARVVDVITHTLVRQVATKHHTVEDLTLANVRRDDRVLLQPNQSTGDRRGCRCCRSCVGVDGDALDFGIEADVEPVTRSHVGIYRASHPSHHAQNSGHPRLLHR